MKEGQQDTPPSSVNGDEITGIDEEGIVYLDEMEEYEFDEFMEQVTDQEEEDADMEPPEDHAAMVFNKHVGSVFSCDLHPDGKLAVTGGEDDKAYVWSVETGQVVLECSDHKDSVVFVGFSFDGAYLATADMCGVIKVKKCNLENSDPWPIAFEFETDDLTWGQWHFGARVLICGTVNGDIFVFKVPSGETKVLQGHNSKVECAKLFSDGIRLAAGYEDGAVKIWDLKTSAIVHNVPVDTVHEGRVTAIDTHPENNLVAAIYPDGHVVLITANNGKIVGKLEIEVDLESVAFSPEPFLGHFALGTLNGAVSIWDVARQMVRHHVTKSNDSSSAGVTKMIWVKDVLVTGCLDGSVRAYFGRSGTQNLMLTGHMSEVLDLCYNEKQNLILTTSDDGTARIFKYEIEKEKE